MKIRTLFFIICAVMIFGCTAAVNDSDTGYSVYHRGKEFSKADNGVKVFNSVYEYRSFLMGRSVKRHDPLRSFDFDNNSLLLAYLGKQAEEGFGLKIISVDTSGEKIIVTAKIVTADENNAPQQFIVIDKTDKKADLILE